jgi:hypothetical protein
MTDRPAAASDRVSEQQGQKGLNVVSAGLNPCTSSFNDVFKEAMNLQFGKMAGQELKPELKPEVEERLSKSGYKTEEIANNPKAYEAATEQAETRAKDDLIQSEVEAQNG